jgi:hypothetical protein
MAYGPLPKNKLSSVDSFSQIASADNYVIDAAKSTEPWTQSILYRWLHHWKAEIECHIEV